LTISLNLKEDSIDYYPDQIRSGACAANNVKRPSKRRKANYGEKIVLVNITLRLKPCLKVDLIEHPVCKYHRHLSLKLSRKPQCCPQIAAIYANVGEAAESPLNVDRNRAHSHDCNLLPHKGLADASPQVKLPLRANNSANPLHRKHLRCSWMKKLLTTPKKWAFLSLVVRRRRIFTGQKKILKMACRLEVFVV